MGCSEWMMAWPEGLWVVMKRVIPLREEIWPGFIDMMVEMRG